MNRPITRLFLLLVVLCGAAVPSARAAKPVVKTITHDASAHNSWSNADRNKWRKKLVTKPLARTSVLIKVRTR